MDELLGKLQYPFVFVDSSHAFRTSNTNIEKLTRGLMKKAPQKFWSLINDVENSGFCEYIMLDDESCTVINVYKMFYGLEELQSKADFNILPKSSTYAQTFASMPNTIAFAKHSGYSIYAFLNGENNMFIPELDDLVYDNSFLENL